MSCKMDTNTLFIEWLYPQAEMIEIPGFFAGWSAARLAEFAGDRHQINHRAASPQLNQSDVVLAAFDPAFKHFAIEAQHLLYIDDTQNQVINLADADHGVLSSRLTIFRAASLPQMLRPAQARTPE